MARILAARELSTAQLISMRDEVVNKLLRFASTETGKAQSEFIVRDIMPKTDLGFNSEAWLNQTELVDATWTKDFTKELPKNSFVCFYGIVKEAESPAIIGTKFKLGAGGATTIDIVMHTRIAVEDIPKGYFSPILYKGGDTIYVEHYQKTGGNLSQYGEAFELMGFIAEPVGVNVSARKL